MEFTRKIYNRRPINVTIHRLYIITHKRQQYNIIAEKHQTSLIDALLRHFVRNSRWVSVRVASKLSGLKNVIEKKNIEVLLQICRLFLDTFQKVLKECRTLFFQEKT